MKKLIPFLLMAVLAFSACSKSVDVNEASLDQFHQALGQADTIVLDVRVGMELGGAMVFIDGAKQIPLATLETNINKLPKNKHIYVVGGDDSQAEKAGSILTKAGFTHVYQVKGTLSQYAKKFGAKAKPYLK